MSRIVWQVPASVRRWLSEVPPDRPVALLLRHSVRDELLPGAAGYAQPITDAGVRIARELGGSIGPRLRNLHSSPLARCIQTGEALGQGAGSGVPVREDRLLGDPGIYVVDDRLAARHWSELGHPAVMEHLVSAEEELPGMARPGAAARFLVQHMLAVAGEERGLHIFVTHDSLVTPTASRLLGEPLGSAYWPWFLEGAFFWRDGDHVWTAYRDRRGRHAAPTLCSFDDTDVVEFARREVARTVGLDCQARFFLAGGAFKTLLTGCPPRDLDLWAPSERDREQLLGALRGRGARRLQARPYADAFEVAGRVVEVPRKTGPRTLEARLERFDIGLAAIGVEHRPRDGWRAHVHPLARLSLARRQILLFRPLRNWKHALVTLERLRRYGDELAFQVPGSEEEAIWRVFDAQPTETKRGMLARFERVARGGHGVHEEAACRLP